MKLSLFAMSFTVLAVLIFGAVIFFWSEKAVNVSVIKTPTSSTAQEGNDNERGVEIEENPTGIALPAGVEVPNLERALVFPGDMSSTERGQIRDQIETLVNSLKKDPNSIAPWLELGLLRKQIGDYQGAKEAWEFTKVIRSGDWVAYHNLADLYGYYLRDDREAEQNILSAINLAPEQIQLYVKAAEIYQDVFNDISKARAIVEKGLTANPGNENLLSLLASLK